MIFMKNTETAKEKINRTREYFSYLFISVLSLLFVTTLKDWLTLKLQEINIFGIDSTIFELIVLVIAIIIAIYFGLIKEGRKV